MTSDSNESQISPMGIQSMFVVSKLARMVVPTPTSLSMPNSPPHISALCFSIGMPKPTFLVVS